MAKKDIAKTEAEAEDREDGDGAAAAEPKKGFVKKILGSKKMLLIAGGALLLLLAGGGGGAYFFLFSKPDASATKTADAAPPLPLTPPDVAYFDMPDLIVNIQTADGTAAYLKLGISLELDSVAEKAGLQALKPRIVDQFQGYLRELRVDDLKGSAGVLRVKEELLRRVNFVAAPYRVKDVLLKEMIVQ
ncbi:MAG TPA: flagellar basal body-associated FliL family protein [Rhizomicrobium sp.]